MVKRVFIGLSKQTAAQMSLQARPRGLLQELDHLSSRIVPGVAFENVALARRAIEM